MRYQPFDRIGRSRGFEAEGSSLEGADLDGLQVVFDQKVGLHPANLQKATPASKRAPARMSGGFNRGGRRYGRH